MRAGTCMAVAATVALASVARDVEVPNLAEATRSVVERANGFRHAEHRKGLATSEALAATAREFAAYMARTDRFDHAADGREPGERARRHGYAYCVISENIAYEYSSRGFATEDLARRFVEAGAAVAHSAQTGRYYAVQMFGRPAKSC